jgi:hypothetical protein
VNGEPFYHLEIPDDETRGPLRSGADGLTFDEQGFAYFATGLGVQICDQPGRVVGIIRRPGDKDISNVVFGGADMQTLYATAIDKIYRRHLRRKGFYFWQPCRSLNRDCNAGAALASDPNQKIQQQANRAKQKRERETRHDD